MVAIPIHPILGVNRNAQFLIEKKTVVIFSNHVYGHKSPGKKLVKIHRHHYTHSNAEIVPIQPILRHYHLSYHLLHVYCNGTYLTS